MNSIIAPETSFSFGKFAGVEDEFMVTSVRFQYSFFVRFSDFNPYDMEETRKHILCVRDGKIVRYKE